MTTEYSTENSSSDRHQLGTVGRGAVLLSFYQLISKPLYAVFIVLLGRRTLFPEAAYGRLESILAIVNLSLIFSDLGLETFLTREIARTPRETAETLPGRISLKIVLSLLSALLVLVWLGSTEIWDQPGSAQTLWVLLLATSYFLMLSWLSVVRSVVRAHQHLAIEGRMTFLEKGLVLLAGGLAIASGYGLPAVLAAFCLASLVSTGYGTIQAARLQTGFYPYGWPDWRCLRSTLPFALSAICVALFFYMDRAMLAYCGEIAVARYSRGLRIVLASLLFPQMFSIAVYPALARLRDQRGQRQQVGRHCLEALMLTGLPIMVGGWLLAGGLVDFLFGAANPDSLTWAWDEWLGRGSELGNSTETAVLRILLLGLPFTCGNYLFGPALNAYERQVWNLMASAWTALLNLLLNLMLIPLLGPLGAALATTAAQAAYSILLYRYLRRIDDSWLATIRWGRLLAGVGGMAVAIVLTKSAPWWVGLVCGVAVYGAYVGLAQRALLITLLRRDAALQD